MTKRAAPPDKKSNRDPKESAQSTTKPEDPFLPPLKPSATLFKVLLLGFAVWLGVLLTLYFKTVYPLRHQAPSTLAAPATTRS